MYLDDLDGEGQEEFREFLDCTERHHRRCIELEREERGTERCRQMAEGLRRGCGQAELPLQAPRYSQSEMDARLQRQEFEEYKESRGGVSSVYHVGQFQGLGEVARARQHLMGKYHWLEYRIERERRARAAQMQLAEGLRSGPEGQGARACLHSLPSTYNTQRL